MITYSILLVIVIIAAFYDIKNRKIPNALTLPAMATGLIVQALAGGGSSLLSGVLGLLIGTGLFFIIYLIGVIGAGDAKLVGAIGAFVGPRGVLMVALLTALAGGLYALFLLLFFKSRTKGTFKKHRTDFCHLCPGKTMGTWTRWAKQQCAQTLLRRSHCRRNRSVCGNKCCGPANACVRAMD